MRSLILIASIAMPLPAQVMLVEKIEPGLAFRYDLETAFSGTMKLEKPGGFDRVAVDAKGTHRFYEKLLGNDLTVRHYLEAKSATTVGPERGERVLSETHRLLAVARGSGVEPAGRTAMTRDDLNLVAEHFDAYGVPGLLPDKFAAVNDTWPIRDEVAKNLCLFSTLVKNGLKGKLVSLDGKVAVFSVEGEVEGIEHGAFAKLSIQSTGRFDLSAKRITKLEWKQIDDRGAGPVGPAMDATVEVRLTRSVAAEDPPEFAAAKLEALLPKNARSGPVRDLVVRHPSGKFDVRHSRDWHAVVQTEQHLVLRLVKDGRMIAQATIAPWPAANLQLPREARIKAFLDATEKTPGWTFEKVLANTAVTTPRTLDIQRYHCLGKQDGVAVRQAFLLVTDPGGAQAVVNCVVRAEIPDGPEFDAELAAGIDFVSAK